MYELTISRKGRKAAPVVTAAHGALTRLPGGMRIRFEQGDNVAALTMDRAEAIRLYNAIGGVLMAAGVPTVRAAA